MILLILRFLNKTQNLEKALLINHSELPFRYFPLFICLLSLRHIKWKFYDLILFDRASKVFVPTDASLLRQQIKNNKFPHKSLGHNL